jgi:tetratricopeptide (TPR) repeat protein
MGRIQYTFSCAFVVALLLVGVGQGLSADDALRQQVLRLNDITGKDAINGTILELIKDKTALKKLVAEAAAMVKEKEKEPPLNYNGAFILAKATSITKDFDNSLVFYKICAEQALKLRSGMKLVDVYDGLIVLFLENKKYEDAVKACQEFLEIRGDKTVEQAKPLVMEQMVLALAKQGKTEDALKITEKLIEADEGGWYFMRLKAEVLRDAGKLDEAVSAYEDTIERLGKSKMKDEELRERYVESCRYFLSGLFTDLKKIDQAAEQLKRLIKDRPESRLFATYHNDLGYIWADHDMNIDEAERLIRKALELDRAERQKLKEKGVLDAEDDHDNAAYLDSLGWVLFKKKDYAEAKKQLLESIKHDEGKHVEIYDHLGDVHKALGEKAEALAIWKKALELTTVSTRDEAPKEAIKKKVAAEEGVNP